MGPEVVLKLALEFSLAFALEMSRLYFFYEYELSQLYHLCKSLFL